jgi:hypothetical protein
VVLILGRQLEVVEAGGCGLRRDEEITVRELSDEPLVRCVGVALQITVYLNEAIGSLIILLNRPVEARWNLNSLDFLADS